jgi:hypothetical protein
VHGVTAWLRGVEDEEGHSHLPGRRVPHTTSLFPAQVLCIRNEDDAQVSKCVCVCVCGVGGGVGVGVGGCVGVCVWVWGWVGGG